MHWWVILYAESMSPAFGWNIFLFGKITEEKVSLLCFLIKLKR